MKPRLRREEAEAADVDPVDPAVRAERRERAADLDRSIGPCGPGLWCFPSAEDPAHWYYIPQTARLARDENGDPRFSFLRYVTNTATEADSGEGITEADGGGIVTLVATYDTSEDVLRRAERELKRETENDEAQLRGPVIFTAGRYALVSSVLQDQDEEGRAILATGNAPVFEGNEVVFSFDLRPEASKILLESFKMDTPDVSIVFEMTVTGLTDAYDALLTVDWEEVESSGVFGLGVGAFNGFLAADVEQGFEELRRQQAIRLVSRGSNENLEALLDKAQQKLLNLMFSKAAPESVTEEQEQQGGMLEGILGGIGDFLSTPGSLTRAMSTFSITGHYEKKDFRKTGTTVLHFNSQTPVERLVTMSANIGPLYEQHGEDGRFFRTVNLSDPAYQQREVHVGIDGAIHPEFETYINSVTVTMRKQHEGGAETLGEVVVDRKTFSRERRDFRMIYGWNEDPDRDRWLEYDYRTRWSFKGGGLFETDWVRTENNMIDLYAPYRRATVELIGDETALLEKGVRAVSVEIHYDFFDGRRSQELSLTTREEIDGRQIEITLPLNVYDYDYTVTWIRRGAEPLVASGTDDTGVIFLDDLPVATESDS